MWSRFLVILGVIGCLALPVHSDPSARFNTTLTVLLPVNATNLAAAAWCSTASLAHWQNNVSLVSGSVSPGSTSGMRVWTPVVDVEFDDRSWALIVWILLVAFLLAVALVCIVLWVVDRHLVREGDRLRLEIREKSERQRRTLDERRAREDREAAERKEAAVRQQVLMQQVFDFAGNLLIPLVHFWVLGPIGVAGAVAKAAEKCRVFTQ
jgi:hypothetical protein